MFFSKLKQDLKLKAFSLLEVMVVFGIMGILMVSISQGKRLMQQAKVYKTASQINQLILAKPAIESSIALDASNEDIWNELEKKQMINPDTKTPAIGGLFKFQDNELILSGIEGKGVLTLALAESIKQSIDGTTETDKGIVTISLGSNYNTNPTAASIPAYILKVRI